MAQQNSAISSYLTKNFVLVTIMMLMTGMCGEMLTPTIPQYTVGLGVDIGMAGMAGTVLGIASMLFRPIAGALIDSVGRKKMAVIGCVLYAAAFVSYLFIGNFTQLLVIRAIQGVAGCTCGTAFSTIITDVVPKDHVTEGLALANVAGAIAMSAGPAIGLSAMSIFGMNAVFFAGAVLSVLTIVLFLPLRLEAIEKPIVDPGSLKCAPKGIGSVIEKTAILPMVMLFLLMFGQAAAFVFLPQRGAEMGVSDVGIFFLVLSVGIIYMRMFIGKILSRFQEQAIMLISVLIFFVCIFTFAFNVSTLSLVVCGLIYGFGYGAATATLNGMALKHCDASRRGAANATFMLGYDTGFAFGSFMWGIIIKLVGYNIAFVLAAIITLSVIPIYFFLYKKQNY